MTNQKNYIDEFNPDYYTTKLDIMTQFLVCFIWQITLYNKLYNQRKCMNRIEKSNELILFLQNSLIKENEWMMNAYISKNKRNEETIFIPLWYSTSTGKWTRDKKKKKFVKKNSFLASKGEKTTQKKHITRQVQKSKIFRRAFNCFARKNNISVGHVNN